MKAKPAKSNRLFIAGGLSTIALIAILVWGLRKPLSPNEVATRAMRSVLAAKSSEIWRNLSEEEVSALDLDEAKLDKFLKEFVKVRIQGFEPIGQMVFEPPASDGTVTAGQRLAHPDGRSFRLVSQASPAGQGDAKLTAFIANTYIGACYADLEPGQSIPGGTARRRFWYERAREYAPLLEEIGIKGFRNASNKTVLWDEWISRNEPKQ